MNVAPLCALAGLIASGVPEAQLANRGRLDREGWEEMARQFEDWIDPA